MSYTIRLQVTEANEVRVLHAGGQLPVGEFVINGHEDTGTAGINIERREANGRFAASAQHTHFKENDKDPAREVPGAGHASEAGHSHAGEQHTN